MTSEYLMDKDPDAACIHFGLNPKPWQHWTLQAFKVMVMFRVFTRGTDRICTSAITVIPEPEHAEGIPQGKIFC